MKLYSAIAKINNSAIAKINNLAIAKIKFSHRLNILAMDKFELSDG